MLSTSFRKVCGNWCRYFLLKACRARGVDCIVAPYEADAQLAYLNKRGIAQVIITEDSDLLLFGCQKVLTNVDEMTKSLMHTKSIIDCRSDFTHKMRNPWKVNSHNIFCYLCLYIVVLINKYAISHTILYHHNQPVL